MPRADERPPDSGRRPPQRYRRRLRTRIILSFLLLGFGLTLLFAFATNWTRNRVENQLVEDVMNKNIDEYARRYYADPSRNPAVPVEQIRAFVFAPDSERLKKNFPDWVHLGNGNHTLHGIDEDGAPFSYKLAVRKASDAWFFLAYDMTQAARGESQFQRAIFISVLVFSLFSLLVGWWAASRVMSPVSELAQRLRDSGSSAQPEALARHFPDDEVGELAKALDDYSSRLTEVVKRDREFNADVSHELRTPLAVIASTTELLQGSPDLTDKLRERLKRIERAVRQSTELTDALLLLSRRERQAPTDGETTDVVRVVEQVVDAQRPHLGTKPVQVRVEVEGPLAAAAPSSVVSVALSNLIGNAFKYTQQGEVVVNVGHGRVSVEDTGPGIAPEDAEKLFERGVRGTSVGKGGGLGLAIVRRLCDLYGWRVSLAPRPQGGAVATLEFGHQVFA